MDQNGKTWISSSVEDAMSRPLKTFFHGALKKHGDPLSITLDAYATSRRAVQELKESGEIFYQKMRVRSCAYLNNVIEQDHRRAKQRINPMYGFKSFDNARVVVAGIEFAHDLRRLGRSRLPAPISPRLT